MNSKYSNILTILLVVVIIAIVAIIGFLGFKYYQSNKLKNQSEEFVDSYSNDLNSTDNNGDSNTTDSNIFDGVDGGTSSEGSSTAGSEKRFNGMLTSGTIEIPATNVKLPIISSSEDFKKGLESAVIEVYGDGLNQVGNTTIAGHNYRNGKFFSNNKKLNTGDKIYITDSTGKRLSYSIYNKYETEENDSEYMTRDTQGAIEISLSTCTDDGKRRLIIWAKADV